jgi:hypothetical protein
MWPDERVDLLDFTRCLLYGQVESSRQLRALLVPAADPRGYIFQGFALTENGAQTGVLVTFGTDARMLLSEVRDSLDFPGQIAEQESLPATLELLGSNFTPAISGSGNVYDLFIRRVYDPSAAQNRAFWNETTATEYLDTVETSSSPTFELYAAVHPAAPGANWTKIAEVLDNGAHVGAILTTDITPKRRYFFEALEAPIGPYVYAPDAVWGDGALDRSPLRGVNGIHDLYTFIHFVRRQLADILGASCVALAGTVFPWTDPDGALPTLGSLLLEHYAQADPSGYGHHHKPMEIHGGLASGTYLQLRSHIAGSGSPFTVAFEQDSSDLAWYGLDLRRPGVASPMVRFMLPSAGNAGGVHIAGPNGPGVDLAGGITAHLRFGKCDDHLTSRDFAIVAYGDAPGSDTARALGFHVGAGVGLDVLVLTGEGDSITNRDHSAGRDSYASGGAIGGFRYTSAKTIFRTLSTPSFLPFSTGGAGGVAVDDPLVRRGVDALGDGGVAVGMWGVSYGTGWSNSGWVILEPLRENILIATINSERLEAALDWLPNQVTIPNAGGVGKQVGLLVEVNAAWAGGDTDLVVVLVSRTELLGPGAWVDTPLAYALFPVATLATAVGPGSQRWVYADWTTTGAYVDPLIHTNASALRLIVQAQATGAGAGTRGEAGEEIRIGGVSLPFDVSYFQH